jgi:hypothetical protein
MRATEQVTYHETIAWLPVKTQDFGWIWLQWVDVITDHRPEIYCGLLPQKEYWIDGWGYYRKLTDDIEASKIKK